MLKKKHENLLWSNYKNKRIPLCFYIFRSLLTPFIRYVLTSCVLSFVFNQSIFLRALNHMRTLQNDSLWYYIFHSGPKVVNFVWSRKITDLLEKFPSIQYTLDVHCDEVIKIIIKKTILSFILVTMILMILSQCASEVYQKAAKLSRTI